MDSDAILPSIKKASDEGIPVIAYDGQIESPNVALHHLRQRRRRPHDGRGDPEGEAEGQLRLHQGRQGRSERDFLFSGITEVLKPAMKAGKIKNVCETFTDGWKPDNAQKNMEQILTKNNNKVDAVVAENDGMAGGVVAALTAQGMAGSVPVSGQDGDHAAINRVALGTQTVSIWKDARDLGKTRRRGRRGARRRQEDGRPFRT